MELLLVSLFTAQFEVRAWTSKIYMEEKMNPILRKVQIGRIIVSNKSNNIVKFPLENLFTLSRRMYIAQLLWLEITFFSKKTSHKIEKHS